MTRVKNPNKDEDMSSVDSAVQSCSTNRNKYSTKYMMLDWEYGQFIKFVKTAPEAIKSELMAFMYPFYIYIYIILMKEENTLEARKFLSAYSKPFLIAAGYGAVIDDLRQFENLEEVQSHSYFKNFWEKKYSVKASVESLKYLKSYLQGAQSRILISLLQSQFHFETTSEKNVSDSSPEKSHSESIAPDVSANRVTNSNSSPIVLKVKRVEEGAVTKLLSFNYSITCGNNRLCSVDIRRKNDYLACGFENSNIHVFKTNDDLMEDHVESEVIDKDSTDEKLHNDKPHILDVGHILKGHKGSVYGLSFTPKQDLLLSSSEDKSVKAWNLQNAENVCTYTYHKFPVWDVATSPNSIYFATSSMDLTACLWSFERLRPIRVFAGHSSDVDCVRFHPNCKYIATASADKTVQLWTIQDGRSVRTFSGHTGAINSIAFAPNGQYLASADDNGYIKIWDLVSGLEFSQIKAHSDRILSLSYDKSSNMIASGGFDGTLKVWNVQGSPSNKSDDSSVNGVISSHPPLLISSHHTSSTLHFIYFRRRDTILSVSVPESNAETV